MFATSTNALLQRSQLKIRERSGQLQFTFCVSTARFNWAIGSVLPIVPRKTGLNWFMPAFVKSKVGSL
jgi:hypothetical protein